MKLRHNFIKEFHTDRRLKIGVLYDTEFKDYDKVINWLSAYGDVELIMANKFYNVNLVVVPDICPYVRHIQLDSISHSATKFSDLEMHKRYIDAGTMVVFIGRSSLIPISEIDDMERHITTKYREYSSFFPAVSEKEFRFLKNGIFTSYRDYLFTVKDSIVDEGLKVESYRTYKNMTNNIIESYSDANMYATLGVPYKVHHIAGSFVKETFNMNTGDFLTNKKIMEYAKQIQ